MSASVNGLIAFVLLLVGLVLVAINSNRIYVGATLIALGIGFAWYNEST